MKALPAQMDSCLAKNQSIWQVLGPGFKAQDYFPEEEWCLSWWFTLLIPTFIRQRQADLHSEMLSPDNMTR